MNLCLGTIVICIFALSTKAFAHSFESPPCELALGLGHRASGLGPRGLLKSVSGLSDGDLAALRERGIFRWNERIFVVRHEDDAHRLNWLNARLPALPHSQLKTPAWFGRAPAPLTSATDAALYATLDRQPPLANPLQRGLFVVDRSVKLDQLEGQALEDFFATLPTRRIFELDDHGRMIRLDPALTLERLDPAAMKLSRHFAYESTHVVHAGYYAPRFRARAALSAIPPESTSVRAIEITRFGSELVAESYGPTADGSDRVVRAAFEGHVIGDVLFLDKVTYAPAGGDELRTLLIKSRDELLFGGIHVVDATKVWELHREPWVHMVPR